MLLSLAVSATVRKAECAMKFSDFTTSIALKQLGILFLIVSVVGQAILISYNHFTGFYSIPDLADFTNRLTYSSVLTFIALIVLAIPNIGIITWFDKRMPWKDGAIVFRVCTQAALTLVLGVALGLGITMLAHFIDSYEEPLNTVLLINARSFAVVNIVLMSVLEAWVFFYENAESKERERRLEKELTGIRFEVLKNQINPHFMFNSLNVLSGLIDTDSEKAQDFIDEFSHIYRYVLSVIEKPVVPVREEIGFINSYIYLQQIRYGEGLQFKTDVPEEFMHMKIPPMALQIPVENAIKHNVISAELPLLISITADKDKFIIRNNLQLKSNSRNTGRLGQEQLRKRYTLIGEEKPAFYLSDGHYIAELPITEQ